MTLGQRALVALAALAGFVVIAITASFVALAFGDSLFGWHDTVGPELGTGFIAGCIGALLCGVWCANRFHRSGSLEKNR